jgi:hypothetical protein
MNMADDWLDNLLATEQPAPAVPAVPPASPSAAPAPPTPAIDSASAALSEIKAIRSDPSHPLNPANHRGDPGKRAQWDALYQGAYGVSSDPAHAMTSVEAGGGWGPAAEAVSELREICSREGHLPQFQGHEMTGGEFDQLVEAAAVATGDASEAKRLVSEISLALWGSSGLNRAAEQAQLRAEWGDEFDAKVTVAARAVAQVFPQHPAEAGKFVAQHPKLTRLAVEWAERQARRARR